MQHAPSNAVAHLETRVGPAVMIFSRYPVSGALAVVLFSDDPVRDPLASLSIDVPPPVAYQLRSAEFVLNPDEEVAPILTDVLASGLLVRTGALLHHYDVLNGTHEAFAVCALCGALLRRWARTLIQRDAAEH